MTAAFEEAFEALQEVYENGDVEQAYAGENKAAATRARKAFLKAKKALHEGRKEIQSIKKGETSPVQITPYEENTEQNTSV